ncbi:MAG: dTDP-4-dehydrorhamnose reductase, partial [Ferrovum sp.]|nr:dTDP-4-dehydrorhamnose reductase [Ferrovum sp.]
MNILLTGPQGQVGSALRPLLELLGHLTVLGRDALDLTDANAIRAAVQQHRPHLIINAAAYTAVDRAETEPALAEAVNGVAPGVLAEEAGRLGAALIHYSTDYVFDGSHAEPYVETDPPHPLGTYGRSKWMGEQTVLASGTPAWIFRTSWVYSLHGANFLKTMLRLGQERDSLSVVDDQWGAPTWAHAIAEVTA